MAAVQAVESTAQARVPWYWLAALAAFTGLLYVFGLSWAPIHLHYDEVLFGEQARSIAATGRDLNGRLLPVYFQMEGRTWFHPVGVYLPAAAFTLFPVSVEMLRAPTALVAVINVVLVSLIALRLFRHRGLAMLAGLLLATTPAHFIHGRMAVDYLFPTPFVLGWCLALMHFFDTRSLRALFAATSLLGLGIYSYIAAVALMPLLLLATLALLLFVQASPRAFPIAIAGFVWAWIPAAWFVSVHPEIMGATLGRYGMVPGRLDVFQQVRELLTPWFLSDRANLYVSFFAPGYLFISGGGSLVGSTRMAGVFLIAILPFLLVGFRASVIRLSPQSLLVLLGLLVPPVAGAVVAEQFAVGRALTMVPFAILLATWGVNEFRISGDVPGVAKAIAVLGIAAAATGVLYFVYRLSSGDVSGGALWLLLCGGALAAAAYAVHQTRRPWPLAMTLLLLCALQFVAFTRDYFGDYRARSAYWFNGNLKQAITEAVAAIDRGPAVPSVLLDQGIQRVDWYWRFHLAELGRSNLEGLGRAIDRAALEHEPFGPGSLLLIPAQDDTLRTVVESRGMSVIATITDPNDRYSGLGPGEHPAYLLLQSRLAEGQR